MYSRAISTQVRLHCIRSLTRPSASLNHATSSVRFFAGWSRDEDAAPSSKSKKKVAVINENIPFPNIRLVYRENGENKWELLTRNDALRMAKSQRLDLVLVNDKEDPPVCRLENFTHMLIKKQMKERENLKKSKHRVLKEFTMGAGIEDKDIVTMMNKAKRLMAMGHPIRISIIAKRATKKSGVKKYHDNPALAVEEVTLKMLETIEGLPVTIQPVELAPLSQERIDGHVPLITAKKEFIISQKIDKKQMKPKLRKAAELLELDDDPKVKAIKKQEKAAAAAAVGGAAAAAAAAGGGAAVIVAKIPIDGEDEEGEDIDETEGDEDDEDEFGDADFDDSDSESDSDIDDEDSDGSDDSDADEEDGDEEDEFEEPPPPPPQPKKKNPFDPRK